MAGTFTQVYIHIIMVVKHKHYTIPRENQEELFAFMSEILRNKNQKLFIVNGTADHVHILFGMNPNYSVVELVRELKSNSTTFINRQKWIRGRFCWWPGYAAFSYGQSQMEALRNHIRTQGEYHKRKSCREEILEFCKKFEIDYDEKYFSEFAEPVS